MGNKVLKSKQGYIVALSIVILIGSIFLMLNRIDPQTDLSILLQFFGALLLEFFVTLLAYTIIIGVISGVIFFIDSKQYSFLGFLKTFVTVGGIFDLILLLNLII
jgi:hypothetical protein